MLGMCETGFLFKKKSLFFIFLRHKGRQTPTFFCQALSLRFWGSWALVSYRGC